MVNCLYRFNRLPYGIKVTPGSFQQIMDTLLNYVDFAIAYMDAILIKSKRQEQQAKHVKEVWKKNKGTWFKTLFG